MASSIDLLKILVEQGKAQLKLQTQQLAVLEKQLWELENPVETRPLSDAEMKKRVLAFETRTAYKSEWKKAIADGLLDNVQGLVNECHETWREKGRTNETVMAAVKKLGKIDSLPWQLFTLQIIKNLHDKGSFWRDDYFDTFEDTAGGCDEIVWDEGCEILKASK
jgi:NAD-specific glutamate dehydrogenase